MERCWDRLVLHFNSRRFNYIWQHVARQTLSNILLLHRTHSRHCLASNKHSIAAVSIGDDSIRQVELKGQNAFGLRDTSSLFADRFPASMTVFQYFDATVEVPFRGQHVWLLRTWESFTTSIACILVGKLNFLDSYDNLILFISKTRGNRQRLNGREQSEYCVGRQNMSPKEQLDLTNGVRANWYGV